MFVRKCAGRINGRPDPAGDTGDRFRVSRICFDPPDGAAVEGDATDLLSVWETRVGLRVYENARIGQGYTPN